MSVASYAIEVDAAISSLTSPRHTHTEATEHVPDAPGLYAIHGSAETWQLLGLGAAPDSRPLYVGKAERSLTGRDLDTHFQTGCTGHSTVRRSLAALLRAELSLQAVPRNKKNPAEKPTHFALEHEGDARLTTWMREKLELAVWTKPAVSSELVEIEAAVIRRWVPPLNARGNAGSPWMIKLRAARRIMAEDVRRWRP